jgi:hypothetical protein
VETIERKSSSICQYDREETAAISVHYIANTAWHKLRRQAEGRDHDLRQLIGHASLLDSVADEVELDSLDSLDCQLDDSKQEDCFPTSKPAAATSDRLARIESILQDFQHLDDDSDEDDEFYDESDDELDDRLDSDDSDDETPDESVQGHTTPDDQLHSGVALDAELLKASLASVVHMLDHDGSGGGGGGGNNNNIILDDPHCVSRPFWRVKHTEPFVTISTVLDDF